MGEAMQTVWQTIAAEFSGIASLEDFTRISLRLFIAALLGGLLGYDREKKGKAAGLRTHMLVALGAALFVLIPQQAGIAIDQISRVLQGVVVGIGFIGAGAIIKVFHHHHEDASGLTTAAGIWLTAAIGVAAGMGQESLAILSTALALIILALLPKVTHSREHEEE